MKIKTLNISRHSGFVLVAALFAFAVRGDQQIPPEESALRAAVDQGGVIRFARGGALSVRQPITVSRDVTLDSTSAAVVISGGGSSRVFHVVAGAKLTLINITVSNGRASSGAGLLNEGEVTLINCIFNDNIADGTDDMAAAGGAIYNAGVLSMSDLALNGNRAVGNVGASGARGRDGYGGPSPGENGSNGSDAFGGAVYSSGSFSATNCSFSSNTAAGGQGGNAGDGGTELSGFATPGGAKGGNAGNGGNAYGAALYVSGEAVVHNVRFANNDAIAGRGGAAGAGGDHVSATSSGDSGNAGRGGVAAGGAVFCDGASLQFLLAAMTENRVIGGDGGMSAKAIGATVMGLNGDGAAGGNAVGSAVYISAGNSTIAKSAVERNIAQGGAGTAGASCFDQPGARFLPSHGGVGGPGGGAQGTIFNSGELSIIESVLDSNALRGGDGGGGGNGGSARTARGSDGGDAGDGGPATGGAVCNLGSATLVNCTIVDNECDGGTGGNGGVSGQARFFNEVVAGGDGGAGGVAGGAGVCSDGPGRTTLDFVTLSDNLLFAGRGGKGGKGSSMAPGGSNPDGLDAEDGRAVGANAASLGSGGVELRNSINSVSGSASGGPPLGSGTIVDSGNNVCSENSCGFSNPASLNNADPLLAALADNGGPTRTMALRAGSPCINAANTADAPGTDQRGFARSAGGSPDIGAFEAGASPAPSPVVGFAIRGRVMESGAPLAGVRIKLGRQIVYTDENGEFMLVAKKRGRYVIRPFAPRTRFAPLARIAVVRNSEVVLPDFVVKRRR